MTSWHWQTWQGQAFLTCDLLQDWAHGFFTRQFWPQTPEGLTAALDATAAVQRVKQIHGNRVITPAELPGPEAEEMAEADGLLSDRPHQALWVCSADCSPVLIGDRATGQASAIHAGWRGTAQAIVPVAVGRLQAQGSRLEDLVVAIGPAIAGEVYQVSVDVAAAVGRTIIPQPSSISQPSSSDEAVVAELQGQGSSPVLGDDAPGKVRLDVRLANRWQLEQMGLRREQVAIAPHCTFQEPERFFSYRRTGKKQVQWSGIVSQGPG